jgi:adenylate kinase
VRNRLEVYRSQTEPLIDYYRPRGKIADIDGAQTPDDVFAQIETAIESAKAGS